MAQTKEIDLKRLGTALLKRAWLILLCIVIVGTSVYIYTDKVIKKEYTATVSIYVTNRSADSQSGFISSSDLATSQRLVVTYINVLMSDYVLDPVADRIGRQGLTAEALRGMITAESPDETEVLYISVTNKNKELAKEIANAIVDVAPAQIEGMVNGSTAKKLDYARKAIQTAPNVTNNTIVGAAVGAMIAVVFICLQVILDVRVKDEEDLARICDVPVLGNIPDFNSQNKSGNRAYGADGEKMGGL